MNTIALKFLLFGIFCLLTRCQEHPEQLKDNMELSKDTWFTDRYIDFYYTLYWAPKLSWIAAAQFCAAKNYTLADFITPGGHNFLVDLPRKAGQNNGGEGVWMFGSSLDEVGTFVWTARKTLVPREFFNGEPLSGNLTTNQCTFIDPSYPKKYKLRISRCSAKKLFVCRHKQFVDRQGELIPLYV